MAEAEPSSLQNGVEPTPAPTNGLAGPKSSSITLRAPSSLPSAKETSTGAPLVPPSLTWLEGTWHVTHSTLPMWKKNRNVRITYSRVPNTSPAQIDDIVTYQPVSSTKLKTVHGVDKSFLPAQPTVAEVQGEEKASLGYHWRGKGWLMIATSKWEVLGFGEEVGGNEWVVTYFAKTLFTPAGVDFYSRNRGGLKEETVEEIKRALAALSGDVAKLGGSLFSITIDDARSD